MLNNDKKINVTDLELELINEVEADDVHEIPTGAVKRIALVAHDNKKKDLLNWVKENRETLKLHKLCGTGTTSTLIREKFNLEIDSYMSGPVGGDQQIGADIAEGDIDILIFFWDPMEMQPHDPDVKALQRLAVLHDCVIATNRATANFVFSSPYLNQSYERKAIDAGGNLRRRVDEFSHVDD